MTRYYFDIDDSVHKTVDDEGIELASPAVARKEALALLPNIAREIDPDGGARRFAVTIRNDRGAAIFEASLTLVSGWMNDPQ